MQMILVLFILCWDCYYHCTRQRMDSYQQSRVKLKYSVIAYKLQITALSVILKRGHTQLYVCSCWS